MSILINTVVSCLKMCIRFLVTLCILAPSPVSEHSVEPEVRNQLQIQMFPYLTEAHRDGVAIRFWNKSRYISGISCST